MKYLPLIALLLIPFASSAATYHYVNTQGVTDTVEAPSAEAALALPADIAPDSGVAIDLGIIEPGMSINTAPVTGFPFSGIKTYQYVNVSGEIRTVEATSAEQALQLALDIAPNSGVLNVEVSEPIPSSVEVNL